MVEVVVLDKFIKEISEGIRTVDYLPSFFVDHPNFPLVPRRFTNVKRLPPFTHQCGAAV